MVCTTLEPMEAEGGNAMLPSLPITATYSYIFRGGARQGTVQIWRLKDAAGVYCPLRHAVRPQDPSWPNQTEYNLDQDWLSQ